MSDDIAISVENVSKAYRIWNDPAARLKAPLFGVTAGLFSASSRPGRSLRARESSYYRDFFALRDISFQVRKGESVGVIGRNGSGKSTLLQIIAGTLQPTAGSLLVSGRVAALLELGSGFNPEFTGRENVFLNAAVLGLTRAETEARFDQIAAFADIGDFLDQPVKTYSSGMMMRLAFGVQTAVDPDVLIVDEALSVGDAPFQAKCFARIRSLLDRGCSTLLVSHDIGTVQAFCSRAVWLKEGRCAVRGTSSEACTAYQRECLREMGMNVVETTSERATLGANKPARTNPVAGWLAEPRQQFEANALQQRSGDGLVKLRNFFFLNQAGERAEVLHWDEEVTAVFVLGSEVGYSGLFQLSINLRTLQGVQLLSCTDRAHQLRLDLQPGTECAGLLRVRLPLRAGRYIAFAGLHLFPDNARFDIGTFDYSQSTAADLVSFAAFVEIAPQFNLGIYGPVQWDSTLSLSGASSLSSTG